MHASKASNAPGVRAMLSQLIWKRMEQGDPDELSRVRQRLSPGTLETLAKPLGIAFSDMPAHMELCVAVHETIGSLRCFDVWRRITLEFGTTRLMRGFFAIAGRVGTDGLLKRVNLAYASQTRALGSARCLSTTPTSAVIELSGFPAKDYSLDVYSNGFGGMLAAAIELSGSSSPSVERSELNEAAGSCRYQLGWENPR